MNKILIVDDEPVILTVLKSILARPDREFLTAETAAQALALAAQSPSLEVALVDKNLPDRTGLEVARELKHQHPDVEVILLTGYASLDSAIEAVKVGAFDYIQKPIEDFDDLNLKVQNAAEKVRLKRDQRRLLDRFAESEERYRGVFQASSDAILVCDAELGRIRDANLAAQKLYGYSREELCALDISRLGIVPPAAGTAEPMAGRHLRKDGSSFPVEVTFGQFLFQRRAMRIVAVRDVTERERAEKERRVLEEHLRHAQKMDAIGRLAGGVAHDFNNLLTIIVGNAEALAGEPPGEKTQERARDIVEASQRAASLTRQLLTFSRKKAARLEPLDLNRVVTDLQKMLRRTLYDNLELVVALPTHLGRALADADQLGQVVLNLALNARDAMAGKKDGKLVIETQNVTFEDRTGTLQAGLAPGNYVMLAVSDNGCGMSRETMDRLFEPFFTTKEPGKGTGLGLATVYAIVQQAGGAVHCYSEPGVGTTFKVYLPRVDDLARPGAPPPPPAPPPRPGRGETVLVAEDEEGVRSLLRRVLTRHGYVVLEGANGREALATARGHQGPLHLLLTDLLMPQMDGRELSETLVRERPGVRVLFMSAYAETAALEHGLVSSPDLFVQKPFTEELLLRQVARALDEASPAPGPAARAS